MNKVEVEVVEVEVDSKIAYDIDLVKWLSW